MKLFNRQSHEQQRFNAEAAAVRDLGVRRALIGRWFFAALGLVGLNVALSLGEVVVVAPLVATTPAFTLLTGWLFFRREVVRLPTIIAIGCIFAGCVLIITR